ncbi:hypothetical protein CFC21_043914 [Triticum aestivum]|uniref:Amino acid transporter transmembrane domain-containing protein n=2 Tax=Triticum aestivum TaxID=4565 RepID=A0A9R1JX15_WHEAT|nr:hypothetical protein CFC21_043914 [Triticum aestivum]
MDTRSSTNIEPPPSSVKTSFLKTCFNGINALSGIGLLSIPYALAQGGWLSLIVFLTIAVICFYTGLLLQRCMDSSSLVHTYPDIGAHAFGRKGRFIVAAIMYVELYLVAIDFLILEGDNLHKLFPAVSFRLGTLHIGGQQAFVLAATLAVLPTTWFRNLNLLAYVAAGGALASVILIGAVLWVGVLDGVGFHERGRLVHWAGLPSTMSLYSFCFSGHAVFPMLYTGMKDRKRLPMITLNLPSSSVAAKVAIYSTLVNPLTKYALMLAPVAEATESALGVSNSAVLGALVRTGLVVGTTVVAQAVPFFADVVGLTGALFGCTTTMLLPCLCYLRVRSKIGGVIKTGLETAACLAILAVGAVIVGFGTYSSVKQIHQRLR